MILFHVRRNAQRGVALILAVFALLILGLLGAGFMVASLTEHQGAVNERLATADLQCADGGISWGYQFLEEIETPPCGNTGSYDLGTLTYADGRVVHPVLEYADTNNCDNEYQGWGYTIHSECGETVIEMDARVMKENPACLLIPGCCTVNAWYWDMDVVQGRMHCNPRIQLWNHEDFPPVGARFFGKVTSSATDFRCGGEEMGGAGCPDGYATFYNGYELDVDEVDCTVSYAAAEQCAQEANGGDMLPRFESWLQLNADGTYTVWQPSNPDAAYHGVIGVSGGVTNPNPVSGVIAASQPGVPGDIHIWGTVVGRLTIMSGRRFYVEGDILLANDPRMGPSDDRLGLLAGWQTAADGHLFFPDIDEDGVDGDRLVFANYVGPHCNACIWVDNMLSRDREGILTIYGSVMQGQLRATEDRDAEHGYGTDTILDPRTCPDPPPCFPDLIRDGSVSWIAEKRPHSWQEVF
jgi:hypothetical protein